MYIYVVIIYISSIVLKGLAPDLLSGISAELAMLCKAPSLLHPP